MPTTLQLKQKEQKSLQEFKNQLINKFGPHLILLKLFGSKARGDFHRESDLDVLVVIKNITKENKDWIGTLAFEISIKYGVFISDIIFSDSDWAKYQMKRFSLARNVEEEGVKI